MSKGDECEITFGEVKEILASLLVMRWPNPGHDLRLFLAVTEATISVALIQKTSEIKLIYFINRVLKDTETRYQQVEKIALALLTAARRLGPYFKGHQVVVRIDHPIAKILRKPNLAGKLWGGRWSCLNSDCGLSHVDQYMGSTWQSLQQSYLLRMGVRRSLGSFLLMD